MKARFFAIALAALCFNVISSAASEGIAFYTANVVGYVNGTAGWSFQTDTPISVTSLGCFNYVLSAQSPISVGLWASGGSLLASSEVTSTSLLVNQSRYESISPVLLSPGVIYSLGAYSPSGTIVFSAIDTDVPGGSVTTSPEIQFGYAVASFPNFAFPTVAGDPGSALLTANFQYVAVPESSSIGVLLLGGLITGWRKKR